MWAFSLGVQAEISKGSIVFVVSGHKKKRRDAHGGQSNPDRTVQCRGADHLAKCTVAVCLKRPQGVWSSGHHLSIVAE